MTVNYEIGRPRRDGRMRVTLILCIGSTKKRIGTDLLASRTDLNRKGKLRNDSPIYNKVRERMYRVEREYSALDTFLTGKDLTASDALGMMRHTTIPTFFEYAERWLSKATMKGKANYRSAVNSFRRFTKGDIPFSMFSHGLLSDYLYTLRDTTQAKTLYLICIKRIYTDAEKDYEIRPFASFRLRIPPLPRRTSRALDIDTVRKVFSWTGKGKVANMARDCAILSFCLCGTNSADLYNAPPFRGDTISYDRTKTKDRRADSAHIEIRIPPQIRNLVRKYRGLSRAFSFYSRYSDHRQFNISINTGLKKIQEELALPKFTFYAFRHTWATIARNDLGIEKSTVHDALNHVERETMIDDIYIKKDFRRINEANRKVVDFIFGTPRKDA